MLRWRIALLVTVAIAINYLDRLTLPSSIDDIRAQSGLAFDRQDYALLNTAFLAAYGTMYLVGGKLLDFLGTRRGFAIIMIFWSLACASHGFANGAYALIMLAVSRLLLGIGEGGGFPAATRAVAEWFPVKERSIAMGMINGGTGIGGMVALPFVATIVLYVHWFDLHSWRWVFFLTGSLGLLWLIWWLYDYYTPEKHPRLSASEKAHIQQGIPTVQSVQTKIPIATLFQYRETWGIVFAKFLTDAAWYFILFWLPTYLRTEHKLDIGKTMSVAWIPHAATFVGCMVGGSISSWLLHKDFSLNIARKLALFMSAALLPLLILVPYTHELWLVILLFSMGYFGQQSWSTLIMVLPTDLFPKRAVGTVAGLVGLGGAMGGIVLGQLSGYLLDNGFTYKPVMLIAGLLHISAFVVILITVPTIRPLPVADDHGTLLERALANLQLGLKLQIPAAVAMLLGLTVVYLIKHPVDYPPMILAAAGGMLISIVFLVLVHMRFHFATIATSAFILAILGLAGKIFVFSQRVHWDPAQRFGTYCIVLSAVADTILLLAAGSYLLKHFTTAETPIEAQSIA